MTRRHGGLKKRLEKNKNKKKTDKRYEKKMMRPYLESGENLTLYVDRTEHRGYPE